MTTKELNRDVKRLHQSIMKASQQMTTEEYFDFISRDAKREYLRLYHADSTFTYMNRSSILIMFVLNRVNRFIPFHQFGPNVHSINH